MWNTGCNVIYNLTAKRRLNIVDGEDPRHALPVDPGDESSFNGVFKVNRGCGSVRLLFVA